jgi:hopanoid biosynthesis associated protein HpnK
VGAGERCLKQLIVTADDFGLSVPVNEAVETAHSRGILTATSLMVGAEAAADAVTRARRSPTLAVGLHLVVVDGQPVLPRHEIPDLLDKNGLLTCCLFCAGLRYFFLPAVRRQLAAEIRAQFDAFRRTGLPLDHVNAHHHMHLHPTVLSLILRLGREFGLRAIRVPAEPLFDGGRLNWQRFLLSPWLALMRWRIKRAGMVCNDQIYGLSDTGCMDQATLLGILQRIPEGASEVFFHPATQSPADQETGATGYHYQEEYAALVHPQSQQAVRAHGISLVAFRDLG